MITDCWSLGLSDDGQPFASDAAAVGEDFASLLGGFAGAKANLAGALFAMRAECWLHDENEKEAEGHRTLPRV